jgi:hypothetical protein
MVSSVAQHLGQTYGIQIRPGGKGVCPFCRRDRTFSVKRDDALGKCFHPTCLKFITAASLQGNYKGSLYEILDRIKADCHAHLQEQAKAPQGRAWVYLTRERGAHPQLIGDLAELGAVPATYDAAAAFLPAFDAIEAREKELQAKIDESQKRRLEAKEGRDEAHKQGKQKAPASAKSKTEHEKGWESEFLKLRGERQFLEGERDKLKELLAKAAYWIGFFHTDAHHRVKSIRFRQPFDKRFMAYAPFRNTGLFGHALFQPYSEANQQGNRLIVVEGELNLLTIQSLAVRTAAPGETRGAYANWVAATGSSSTVDTDTIKALLATPGAVSPPVVIQDNDDAGDGMVETLRKNFTLQLVTPTTPGHDIEDHLRAFGTNYAGAFASLAQLLREPRSLMRDTRAVAEEIFGARQKHGEEDTRREFEIHAEVKAILLKDLRERGTFYHEHQQGYFFHNECRQLIALDDRDKELSLLLANYGLNATEKCFEYQAEALHVEALAEGFATRVYRFCHFNPQTFALYVFNHASGIYKVTADGITQVDNGTDGVLFLRDRRNEPFEFLPDLDADAAGDLFHDAVTSKIHFATDARLDVCELQALFNFWFLATFFGTILPTRPLLAFIGPKGSGKSHTLRKVGTLLFGPQFEVKNLPDKEDSFDAITTNTHFAAFDNADSKVAWLPDRLAICATGGTVSKRKLYTTNMLVDYPIDCFVGITSRTPYFQRDDVADRLLVFHVRRFGEGEFIAESELLAGVLKDRDRIMTVVLRQLQQAIRALKETATRVYKTSFRMADFATFVLRIADVGGNRAVIEDMFDRMGDEQAAFTLDGDTLVEALNLWLKNEKNHRREMTAAGLHKELAQLAEAEKVEFAYKSSRSLAQRLSNTEHNLRSIMGVKVTTDPHKRQKRYTFWPLQETAESGGIPFGEDSADASA